MDQIPSKWGGGYYIIYFKPTWIKFPANGESGMKAPGSNSLQNEGVGGGGWGRDTV